MEEELGVYRPSTLEQLPGLSEEDRITLKQAMEDAAKDEKVSLDDVRVVPGDVVPMRLQHIFRDLGKEGFVVKESLVLNGRLFLIAVRKGKPLDIAPDFEYRE
ncbi:MAG: hypothetical protein J7L55_05425 [Desulfurococcales archaeon]|nr:hypothetical protein [Desulfurococcales archaeon]